MTTSAPLLAAMVGLDLQARLSNATEMIDEFLMDAVKIPDMLNIRQALILARLVRHGQSVTAGQLKSFGFYTGTNTSYNLTGLLKSKYLEVVPNRADRRKKLLRLTPQGETAGKELLEQLNCIEECFGKLFSSDVYHEIIGNLADLIHVTPEVRKARLEELRQKVSTVAA